MTADRLPAVLTTRRLLLREMIETDLDFIASMLGDPEVMRFYPKTYTQTEAEDWLRRQRERYARDGHGLWLTIERTTETPIGQVGLMMQDVAAQPQQEIGYLIHRPFWRKGYASEAALAVRAHAFRQLGLSRVISMIRPENQPSQGVARTLGMSPERRLHWRGFEHDVWAVSAGTTALHSHADHSDDPSRSS